MYVFRLFRKEVLILKIILFDINVDDVLLDKMIKSLNRILSMHHNFVKNKNEIQVFVTGTCGCNVKTPPMYFVISHIITVLFSYFINNYLLYIGN